ncbi:putative pre-mRNA-splicing factor ATP-dependent RNA helicase DEAH5 [Camellia lanceoleosa]|uniref:Pre-mRNA-splicing factor ATP-dependent RNA helicase DEAH5 n=1 Tax=Camellia lanceoleosa TaxID=1840588 RepID=A0ACC0FQS0_9ERIC|nr:putative pre-mRNA-splicing factor ATP-dependent RNA helicase DEAH5 [Camellia lanceoleosa]
MDEMEFTEAESNMNDLSSKVPSRSWMQLLMRKGSMKRKRVMRRMLKDTALPSKIGVFESGRVFESGSSSSVCSHKRAERSKGTKKKEQCLTLSRKISIVVGRPNAETDDERHLAQSLGELVYRYDMPDWKKDAFGKAPTFGQRSKLSIQDRRHNLPIYKLKNELIQCA